MDSTSDRKLETRGVFGTLPEFQQVTDIHDSCTRLVGNLNVAAGLSYVLLNCFSGDLSLAVGYEMNRWLNTADFLGIELTQLAAGDARYASNLSTVRNQDTLGFDGLFVRVGVGF